MICSNCQTEQEGLSIWTIYDHPTDYPDCFVARRFVYDKPTNDIVTSNNLEYLRAIMIKSGLICFLRSPDDDPIIIESWL
jgi:hypothetical protein